jgi:folate-binding protein YgfZ
VDGGAEIGWARGPDAVTFLDGLLTQDVAAIPVGGVARSLLLDPRGKLRAMLWLLRGERDVGLITEGGGYAGVAADLNRFRIRVDVEIDPEPSPLVELWGPNAAEVAAKSGYVTPDQWGWRAADGAFVAGIALGPLPRFFFGGIDPIGLVEAGAVPVGAQAATAVRIEAGEPRMGVDVDERTIPQESGLVPATVSFTKGCYLGQELVARIDSRGHVNRHLRGVTLAENVLPPPGSELVAAGKTVGAVTSVGESLELRAPVALALVRREIEPGAAVEVRWDGGSARATVRELPLDDFAGG